MIFLAVIENDGAEARAHALTELLTVSGLAGFKGIRHYDSGKPYLYFDPPRRCGYSLSKFRHDGSTSALMALSGMQDIGIDAEVWPEKSDHPEFLESIAGPDDQKAIQRLARTGRDAGTALWVMKEAALKCCDAVNIDPRHVAIEAMAQNQWRAIPGQLAGAPFPAMTINLGVLKSPLFQGRIGLVATAAIGEKTLTIKVVTPDWNHSMLVT